MNDDRYMDYTLLIEQNTISILINMHNHSNSNHKFSDQIGVFELWLGQSVIMVMGCDPPHLKSIQNLPQKF